MNLTLVYLALMVAFFMVLGVVAAVVTPRGHHGLKGGHHPST
jgi:hypothetical protein